MSRFCVIAGTRITLNNKETIPIENIKVNQEILSFNLETLQLASKSKKLLTLSSNKFSGVIQKDLVKNIWKNTVDEYFAINDKLKITADHIVLARRGDKYYWTTVDKLEIGDYLFTEFNVFEKIETIILIKESVKVYNLQVNRQKNYFANHYLIHNGDPCDACDACGAQTGSILTLNPYMDLTSSMTLSGSYTSYLKAWYGTEGDESAGPVTVSDTETWSASAATRTYFPVGYYTIQMHQRVDDNSSNERSNTDSDRGTIRVVDPTFISFNGTDLSPSGLTLNGYDIGTSLDSSLTSTADGGAGTGWGTDAVSYGREGNSNSYNAENGTLDHGYYPYYSNSDTITTTTSDDSYISDTGASYMYSVGDIVKIVNLNNIPTGAYKRPGWFNSGKVNLGYFAPWARHWSYGISVSVPSDNLTQYFTVASIQ